MLTNPWFWVWVGLGVLGHAIIRRNPRKLVFDDPIVITFVAVISASGIQIFAGPIYLIIAIVLREKIICVFCGRANLVGDPYCSRCSSSLEERVQEYISLEKADDPNVEKLLGLSKKYLKWDLLAFPILLVSTPIFTIIWWYCLWKLGDWRFSKFDPTGILLLPTPMAWLFPAFFLGIITSVLPAENIYRILLRGNYNEYKEYQKLQYQWHPSKVGIWFYRVSSGCLLFVVILMLDWYMIAGPNGVVINTLWDIGGDTYQYSEIRAIRSSRRLMMSDEWEDPLYVIEFRDGEQWSTRWEDRDSNLLASFFRYISDQSGIQIHEVPVLYDSDL